MTVLVLSDIHDHIWNLQKVLGQVQGSVGWRIGSAIFCGDLVAPFSAAILSLLNVPIYACLGNNDEDHIAMLKKGGENFVWFPLSREFGEIELDGRKIAFCHYPKLGRLLALSGDYDAVFYGHTHKLVKETIGQTLLLNPGAVCGIIEGKPGAASYALYEPAGNTAEVFNLS